MRMQYRLPTVVGALLVFALTLINGSAAKAPERDRLDRNGPDRLERRSSQARQPDPRRRRLSHPARLTLRHARMGQRPLALQPRCQARSSLGRRGARRPSRGLGSR